MSTAKKEPTENSTVSIKEGTDATKGAATKGSSDTKETNTVKKQNNQKSVYTIDEFCNNARKLFNTMPECVRAALTVKGITQCDEDTARKVVKEFIKKEGK